MRRKIIQEPPFCIKVEITEGCNLFCSFCGLQGIRSKTGDYKFMSMQIAKILIDQLVQAAWNPRIEFALHGEPTVNPDCVRIVKMFRALMPKQQLMMTTNGMILARKPKTVNKLFDAGLNILAIDDYGYAYIEKLRRQFPGLDYPKNLKASPHRRWPKDTQIILYLADIRTATSGCHSRLANHCGCAAPPVQAPLLARCTRPFREISVRWDGTIAICCNDFRGEYVCGDIRKESIRDIWQNDYFVAARKFLYNYDRNFFPCSICNDTFGYRVGLLPDKKGKQSLPKPTERDRVIVNEALSKGPLTKRVKPKWKSFEEYL